MLGLPLEAELAERLWPMPMNEGAGPVSPEAWRVGESRVRWRRIVAPRRRTRDDQGSDSKAVTRFARRARVSLVCGE